MLSWSDFATLLLALFAAMYASASVERAKADAAVQALARSVSQSVGQVVSTAAVASPEAVPAAGSIGNDAGADNDNRRLANAMAASLAALGVADRAQVRMESGTVGIDINAELLFREGDAALSAGARELLSNVAQALHDPSYTIRVEGHTDSKPIANDRYASNWELSAARAAVVVRQLIVAGIAEHRMTAVGMAANEPRVSNESADGRARNRRVHLVLVR